MVKKVLNFKSMDECLAKHARNEIYSMKLKQWAIQINKKHQLSDGFLSKSYSNKNLDKRFISNFNSFDTECYGRT